MAHNNWYVLEKLIQIIDAPWNDIYLHIDRKAKDFSKEHFLSVPKFASIRLTKRHSVTWGNESQITAEMELFKTSYKNGPYHYYHFISGSDLPLLNAQEIYNFFENKNCNYLHTEKDVSPFEWRLRTYIEVFRQKWIPLSIRKKLNIWSEILQFKIQTDRLKWLRAHYPIIGKGHNWCDLTQGAVQKLIEAHKDIRKFTRFTHCSDEMYKQIVLLNQDEDMIGSISTTNIRYIDWRDNVSHPHTFTITDYNTLINVSWPKGDSSCNVIFARKFDEKVDRQIIDMIFSKVIRREDGRE